MSNLQNNINFQRIMIIGCSGAGKSTLSKKLHKKTGLPLIHLDKLFWNPGWVETGKAEWEKTVERITDQNQWITDGNYGGTMDIRLKKADTVIFLNRPTWLCLIRVIKRTLKNYGESRDDLPEDCKERFEWEFLKYVYNYNRTRRENILQKLKAYQESKNIFILHNEKEIRDFLASV